MDRDETILALGSSPGAATTSDDDNTYSSALVQIESRVAYGRVVIPQSSDATLMLFLELMDTATLSLDTAS